MNNKAFRVFVIGGINLDIIGKSIENLELKSSNPGSTKMISGGVSRNIAQNLSQLGIETTILSSVGKDSFGEMILKELKDANVNTSKILISENFKTGLYLAILNNTGEMSLGLSDMDVMKEITKDYLESNKLFIKDSDFIICDTNLEKESILFLINYAKINQIPICVEPVSVTKSKKLNGILNFIDFLTPNKEELFSLAGIDNKDMDIDKASSILLDKGVKNIILTLGSDGLYLVNKSVRKHYTNYPSKVLDVTGAGDSLTAGFIYGLLNYNNIDKACKFGLAAASLTVSSKDTVSTKLNKDTLERIITF